ncbi:MAG: M13 family metallopeptidase [Kofleriaceae bacterium]
MRLLQLVVLAAWLAACGSGTPPPAPPGGGSGGPVDRGTPHKPVTTRSLASTGLDPAALDRKADPCDDFYQFSCGGWIASTEIAADKPLAMRSFVDIEDRNQVYLKGVLEEARTKPTDELTRQLGAFYGSCVDEAAIEKAGMKPIGPLRAIVNKVRDVKTLSAAVGQLHAAGFGVLFGMGPTQDSADARSVIASLDQGGLGLPDRDYYLQDSDATKGLKAAYEAYVATLLGALGRTPAAAKADASAIIALETAIAKVHKDKVAMRDPKGTYNKIDKAGVAKAMPSFDWKTYWAAVGLAGTDGVTVSAPEFLAGLDPILRSTKPALWRAYLEFHVANRASAYLPKNIEDTQFKFFSVLSGQPEQEARWKRCVAQTDTALGDLLGQLFVRDRFAGASKTAAEEQVGAIVTAMSANLTALPWMDAQTKAKAFEKLKAMSYQIGFPRKWRTYSFPLDAKAWGANGLAGRKAERQRVLSKIGKPVDKDDWEMTAPAVNAYYQPQLNGMVFPAGILQPPFYSVDFATPVNLGGMGVVVGHELTHGFDDQGSQFDAVGNLVNWWQPDTEKQFKARTQCVKDQYSAYTVAGGTKLNGGLTAGENIADIGGVKLALAGYRALRASAPDTVVADGFTEDQQFFLGFGQAWCAKLRPELEKYLATVDPHSPAKWRVNGALSATSEFAKAFRCTAGKKMVPAKQCIVW